MLLVKQYDSSYMLYAFTVGLWLCASCMQDENGIGIKYRNKSQLFFFKIIIFNLFVFSFNELCFAFLIEMGKAPND